MMPKIVSYLFIFASPILCGVFLAIPLVAWFGETIGGCLFGAYSFAWLGVWHDYYDQGRKLDL